jgi:acyl carrier protein
MVAWSNAAVSEIIAEYIVRARSDRVGPSLDQRTALIDEGILDSLFLIQLVAFLESRFSIAIDSEAVTPENFETIERIATLVQASLGEGAQPA